MKKDLYKKILAIEIPADQQLDYYLLLNLEHFESDGRKIHKAGLMQIKKLREWQLHPDADIQRTIQEMLNEVSMACSILEIAGKKQEYDHNLATQLHIDLNLDENYHTLTNQSELTSCPNCRAQVSKIAIICIECGYNFETKSLMKSERPELTNRMFFIEDPAEEEQVEEEKPGCLAGFFAWLGRMVAIGIKIFLLLVVVGIILIVVKVVLLISSDSRYKIDNDGSYTKHWREYINESPLWATYFKYKAEQSPGFLAKNLNIHSPCVVFKLVNGTCKGRSGKSGFRGVDVYITDLTGPEDQQELYRDKAIFGNFEQFKGEARTVVNNSAQKCLIKLADKDPEFLELLKKKVKYADNNNTGAYLEVLSETNIPEDDLKKLLKKKLKSKRDDVRETAESIIEEKNF